MGNADTLKALSKKINAAEEQKQFDPTSMKNFNDMEATETFKAKKKRKNFAGMYAATNYGNENNRDDFDDVSDAGNGVNSLRLSQQQSSQMRRKIKQIGKSDKDELETELRHKYLTILKSIYWEFYEEGQCMAESIIVLIESADRALDQEEKPMQDWTFI